MLPQYYETEYNPAHNAPLEASASAQERQETEESFKFAKDNFRPLYYTMQYPQDKSKIEMSFDLTHYQPQFRGEKPAGPIDPTDTSGHRNESRPVPDAAREAQNEEQIRRAELRRFAEWLQGSLVHPFGGVRDPYVLAAGPRKRRSIFPGPRCILPYASGADQFRRLHRPVWCRTGKREEVHERARSILECVQK